MIKKPLILIVGAPHSMTSMIARFLISNGCGSGLDETKISGYKGKKVTYIGAEDWPLKEAVARMRRWKHDKKSHDSLKRYFYILPDDEVIIMKVPWAALFLDKIAEYSNKPIKIVYCLRNPHDVMISSFEKQKIYNSKTELHDKNFFRLYHLYNTLYKMTVQSEFPLHILPVERLANKDETLARELLWFCLRGDIQRETNWSTIETRHIKKRKYVYLSYRMSNFVFKMVDRITKRMNW